MAMRELVLAVNPAPTFTKVGLFRGLRPVARHVEQHPDGAGAHRIIEELPMRTRAVRAFLDQSGVGREALAAVVGRGGLLRPVESGTYVVDDAMLRDVERAEHGEHPANLGGPIAKAIADDQGCPAFVVDPLSVDELEVVARISGISGVPRRGRCDALLMRAAARHHAAAVQRPLEELRVVVAHVGGTCSLCAMREGRLVEVVNRCGECPLSSDGQGSVPPEAIISMCFAPGATAEAVRRRVLVEAGLFSHAGTRSLEEVAQRAERGDAKAIVLLDALSYQAAKCIGELAVALGGEVDAVLVTGAGTQVTAVVNGICRRVEWIAPVFVYPGEDDLLPLAEGAWRVLNGEEQAKRYG
jgi:butyrate kinase